MSNESEVLLDRVDKQLLLKLLESLISEQNILQDNTLPVSNMFSKES